MQTMKVFEKLSMEVVFGGHAHLFCKEGATVEVPFSPGLSVSQATSACKVCSHEFGVAKGLTHPDRGSWPRNR